MLQQQAETTCSLRRYFCFLILLLTYFMNLLATWVLLSGPAECAERSAAPPQVAPRAKFPIQVFANIYQAKVAQLQKPRPRSPDYPLSISPPGHAHSAGPAPRSLPYRSVGNFFRFLAFQKILENLLRKNIEKNSKIEDFGLPKPS